MFPPSLPSPSDLLRSLFSGPNGLDPFGLDLPGLQDGDGPDENGRPRNHHDAHQRHVSDRAELPPGPPGTPAYNGPGQPPGMHRGEPAHPLLRELQQLPPETLHQLIQYLSSNPQVARELVANPESLAGTLARAAANAQESQHLAAAMARAQESGQARTAQSQQVASPERAATAQDIARLQAMPDGRLRDMNPAANDAVNRMLQASLLARADGAVNTAATVPQGNPATTAQGTTQQLGSNPLQNLPARPAGEPLMPSRADVPVAGDRLGLPAGNALAAGVTVAAIGNPAGTTHAVAPQTPAQLREAARQRKAREAVQEGKRRKDDNGGNGGHGSGQDKRGSGESARAAAGAIGDQQNDAGRSPSGPPGSGADARHPDDRTAAGNTAATARPQSLPRSGSPRPQGRRSVAAAIRELSLTHLLHAAEPQSQAQGHAGDEPLDPTQRRSRRLRWLYWSLILVAYLCLGVSLALVLPGLWNGAPAEGGESADWWRALTVIGLGTAFCAWLLARRLR